MCRGRQGLGFMTRACRPLGHEAAAPSVPAAAQDRKLPYGPFRIPFFWAWLKWQFG